jgi:hypothetical protein
MAVLPDAPIVISGLVERVESELRDLLSRESTASVEEEAEAAIYDGLSVLADIVRAAGAWVPFDGLLRMISHFLAADLAGNESFYDGLGGLLTAMLSSGTPRFEAVVRTILTALESGPHLRGVAGALLEPIQGLIGSNPGGFLALGVSEAVVGLCAALLPLADCDEAVLAIGGLIANVAVVDAAVGAECEQIAAELMGADRADRAFCGLEISVAALIRNGRISDPRTTAMIARAVAENWVVRPAHARLLQLGLRTAASLDASLAGPAAPLLAELQAREEALTQEDRDRCSAELDLMDVPDCLLL